ncbi:MAG TPA: Crp/Fnr family transcriptional regulator [Flavisolibacter sp.]|nr:Crp/Fnr family transcriptional regulator [Flavisolibacter sp.]
MDPLLKVREALSQFAPSSDEEWDLFSNNLKNQSIDKGNYVIKEGQVENYIYFIQEGVTRSYFTKEGKEFTVDFHFANEFVSSYFSFLTREPSRVSIEVLEPVVLYKVHHHFLQEFYKQYHHAERIGRLIAEFQYIKRLRREMDLLSLTAEERYAQLMQRSPHLVNQISIKHLSSYLGIQPESLSRIRKAYSR